MIFRKVWRDIIKRRDVLDEVWAVVMGAEAAFVRHSIVSGTHALTIGLFGLLYRICHRRYQVTGR